MATNKRPLTQTQKQVVRILIDAGPLSFTDIARRGRFMVLTRTLHTLIAKDAIESHREPASGVLVYMVTEKGTALYGTR